MTAHDARHHPLIVRGAKIVGLMLCASFVFRHTGGASARPSTGALASTDRSASSYSGVVTFSTTGNGDYFSPAIVQDLDLGSNEMTVRFNGVDATRARSGETAYITRLESGFYAQAGIVVADTRGIPGPPLYVCTYFHPTHGRTCGTPKLSPDGRFVAFSATGSGSVCKGSFDMYWSSFVIVVDRRGTQIARFEGYSGPEWLPNERLVMMGSACRYAGIWLADQALRSLSRIDGDQVSTPAGGPAVSPDGRQLAFVWNNQLWSLPLAGRPELTQLTHFPKPVASAAWSPDGSALAMLLFDVSMPVRSLVLMHPGDERSAVVKQLSTYPYGPISWR